MPYDVITIGGATQDIFMISPGFRVENDFLKLRWGEKFVVEDLFLDIGGGACNGAVSFARLGLRTAFWGRVGKDLAGEAIAQRLKREGVSMQFLMIDEKALTSTSCLLVKEGEHTIVMYRGRNDDLLRVQPSRGFWDGLCDTRWFYLTDVASTSEDLTYKIAELAENRGINLAFVPGQHQLNLGVGVLKPVLRTCEVFILNVYEACQLLGRDLEIKEMLKIFRNFGVGIVVITRDIHGVAAFDGKEFYKNPAPQVGKVTDTTGAGDAFSSAFVAALIKGKGVEEALGWGTKNAGSVISKLGAQTGLLKIEKWKK